MRPLVVATLLVFTASACKEKPPEPKVGAGSAPTSVGSSAATAVSPPPTKIEGPAVSPVITNNITFVVPAATSMWAEMNFACYRAVMTLQGGGPEKAAEAFEGISPKVPGAMKAAEIDLGRDLQAIGGFDCGDGSPCFYIAARLAKPEKLKDALAVLVPDATPKEAGTLHFTTQTGPRTLHIRAIPIQWPAAVPTDAYAMQQRTATHVVFIGGVDGKNVDADPMTKLAKDGVATVNESEKLLADTHNRCMIGRVAPRDFVPGFKLTGATFALGVPPAKAPDAMLKLLGSEKTFDLQFDLGISPAPKEADVQTWITMGKAWLGDIGQNVRASFAGQDAAMDIYFDMLSMVGEGGFRHALTDKGVRFSWRTDRIPASNITALEAKLNALAQ